MCGKCARSWLTIEICCEIRKTKCRVRTIKPRQAKSVFVPTQARGPVMRPQLDSELVAHQLAAFYMKIIANCNGSIGEANALRANTNNNNNNICSSFKHTCAICVFAKGKRCHGLVPRVGNT